VIDTSRDVVSTPHPPYLNIGAGLALAGSEIWLVKKSREMPWSSAASWRTAPRRS
jgi:hypothetical protein